MSDHAGPEDTSSVVKNFFDCLVGMFKAVFFFVVLLPILIVCYFIGVAVWLALTFTCIGPISQCCINAKDEKLLNRDEVMKQNSDLYLQTIPGGIHSSTDGAPYQVMVRYTAPPATYEGARYPIPVCIPNGLGATIVTISILHERLAEVGFTVLSYDRLGVGWSDINPTARPPSAKDVVEEMHYVMEHAGNRDGAEGSGSKAHKQTKWILIGPSMGSTVSQAYIASPHGGSIVGFLNMDGLPYPFIRVSELHALSSRRVPPLMIFSF